MGDFLCLLQAFHIELIQEIVQIKFVNAGKAVHRQLVKLRTAASDN